MIVRLTSAITASMEVIVVCGARHFIPLLAIADGYPRD